MTECCTVKASFTSPTYAHRYYNSLSDISVLNTNVRAKDHKSLMKSPNIKNKWKQEKTNRIHSFNTKASITES